MNFQNHKIFFLLDNINPHAIKTWVKRHERLYDYMAQNYSFFANRRAKVMEELEKALREEQKEFQLNKPWKRIISQQFSNSPLSTTGSVLNFPGGRFNIGKIDVVRFPQFPALYIAEDTQTAYLESLGLRQDQQVDGLTTNDLAVAGNFSHFNITGKLTQVLDLRSKETLSNFYKRIEDIELPIYYRHEANNLGIAPLLPVHNLNELYNSIFVENWRFLPMQFDAPSNSQIIGQIAHSAGLEAILYPSSKNNHLALCIFPDNFKDSDACIEIVGEVANTVLDKRIDKETYKNFLPTKWS